MKTTSISSFCRCLAAASLLLPAVPAARAANITWEAPSITTGNLSDISTQGTVLFAWTANPDLSLLAPLDPGGLNITFENGPALNQALVRFDEFTWLDAGYDAMLDQGNWADGNTTIQLPGLTPNRAYQIQFWVSDTRGCCGGRIKTIGDGNGNNVDLNNGNPAGESENVIGTWVADGTTQALALIGSGAAHPVYNAIIVRDISTDTDSDGMFDAYEDANGLNKNVNDAAGDLDGDTLTNFQEFNLGTRANLADTDGDGLSDKVETKTGTYVSPTDTGTNPIKPDTDGDLLNDGAETNTGVFANPANAGTNPFNADTDADGFTDGVEVVYSTSNPVNPASRPLRSGLLDLIAYFPFDDASDPTKALDIVKGFVGVLENTTAYTANGGGRTGVGNDKAIDFGATAGAGNAVFVQTGGFLNIGATQDQIAISFWQQLSGTPQSSSFWGDAPSVGGRGINAHSPWEDGSFYWDTSGCCGGTQRVSGPVGTDLVTPTAWHHFVFQKNGSAKEVWLDGVLAVSGPNTAPLPSDFTVLHIGSDLGAANITGLMDDFAVYGDALTQAQIALLNGGTPPNSPLLVPPNTDSDGDGMPNAYETANGLNPNADDRAGDLDADGKTNFDEFLANTSPNNPDTDGDGLKDGVETKTGTYVNATNTGTDPLKVDSDNDDLPDGAETGTGVFVSATNTGTNPNKLDTDGDTFGDGAEVKAGSNPVLASSVPPLELVSWWPFNDTSRPLLSADVIHQYDAEFLNGADFSDDALGRTGLPGDRALNFGTSKTNAMAKVMNVQWLNDATGDDDIAFSFWQNLSEVSNSSSFWVTSPSSSGRGMQGHATWGDNNYYWDTGGCCDATHRIGGFPNDVDPFTGVWHHFVFQKSGPEKEIWVDGVLKGSGSNDRVLATDHDEITIGAEPSGANQTLGLIDDFAIFETALGEADIGRLAAGEAPTALLGPAAPLAITAVSINAANHTVTITWSSQANTKYALEGSRTMANGSWIEINDNIASGGATTAFTYDVNLFPPGGSTPPILFLRVVKP